MPIGRNNLSHALGHSVNSVSSGGGIQDMSACGCDVCTVQVHTLLGELGGVVLGVQPGMMLALRWSHRPAGEAQFMHVFWL